MREVVATQGQALGTCMPCCVTAFRHPARPRIYICAKPSHPPRAMGHKQQQEGQGKDADSADEVFNKMLHGVSLCGAGPKPRVGVRRNRDDP